MILGLYYKSAFLLFFFVQGGIFSLLLLVKGVQDSIGAARWLSLLIFLACLYVTPWMLGHNNWYAYDGYREFLFFVPFHQLFLLGPVIYFYIRSLLDPAYRLRRRDWWHFVPAALYLGYSLLVFVVDELVLEEYYFYADGRDKDLDPWYQITGLAMMVAYTFAGFRNYQAYRNRIYKELSFADAVVFQWAGRFLIGLLICLGLRLLFLIILPNWGDFGSKWWYYLAFAAIFYYIALAGYTHTIATSTSLQLTALKQIGGSSQDTPQTEASTPTKPTEEESLLSSEQLEYWKARVLAVVKTQEAYQDPGLTLRGLSQALETNPRQISRVINQGFSMNFNDFINQHRVEAVKQRLAGGDHQQFTILSIALECGFNSKTTFNRAFKKFTDRTPNQFLKGLEE